MTARPFVFVNMAMSADGKITSAARETPRMTSRRDRDTMDRLRAGADAVAIGAGTLRADHPKLHVRAKEERRLRRELGKTRGLLKVVVTASGDLDPASRSLEDPDGGGIVIATTESAEHPGLDALADRARIWRLGARRVDLPALLHRLADDGVGRLLVEGGSELNAELFAADLVDELYLTVAPAILGGRDAPTPVGGYGFTMAERRRLRLLSVDRAGDELYTHWAVERPA